MVTSVTELSDKLYKAASHYEYDMTTTGDWLRDMSRICANAHDMGLPLLVVQKLLKGTDYEQLLS